MLTLNADSACDVCAEEYGPFNLPHCIPCGHVLCATCADTIVQKTSPRLTPACPFCREHFTRDVVRVIRIDFSGSSGGGTTGPGGGALALGPGASETCIDGGAYAPNDDEMVLYDVRYARSPIHSARSSRDPSRATSPERPSGPSAHQQNGIFTTINEDHPGLLPPSFDVTAHRDRARELEKKVAKIATKRCSAEEVHAIQRELGEWLATDKILGSSGLSSSDKQQHAAIQLSHLLIRAILMNHLAHSEATRVAKGAEAQLRARIADGELVREKLDEDLRKTKNLLQTRTHEVSLLKGELARLRGEDPSEYTHNHGGAVTPTRRQSLSAPTSPDGYFSYGFSSASTAVPPYGSSSGRSNPSSGANSPSSSGRTTPTAGLALGGGGGGMMPMGSNFPPIGMTLSNAGAGPGAAFMSTSGGMSSASAAASRPSPTSPPRPRSTAPGRSPTTNSTPTRPQSTVPSRASPSSPTPAPGSASQAGRYAHIRSASMIHRSATVAPSSSSSSASASASAATTNSGNTNGTSTSGRERRSMTPAPAPVHQRSASVAPGAMSSSAVAARGLTRSMTPTPNSNSSIGVGNGSSAGGVNGGASGIPPVPALPLFKENGRETVPVSALSHSFHSTIRDPNSTSSSASMARPPVPPKPRTLSQSHSPSSHTHSLSQASSATGTVKGGRGVVDDRDGYATEKELGSGLGLKKEKKRGMHERWLPSALVDRMSRPATSMG